MKWLKIGICFAVTIFGLYTSITYTRPDFLFEKHVWKSNSLVMKDNDAQIVQEYGISVGASKKFSDGKLGFLNDFSGLCYVKVTYSGISEYRWGRTLTVVGKWEKGSLTSVTLK